MRSRKVLITGSNGYIGSNLAEYLKGRWRVYSTDLAELKTVDFPSADISDFTSISRVIERAQPDVVVHTAGISSLARCEKNPEIARKINVVGTKNIIKAINEFNPEIRLVFLSSDYVFDGEKGNYSEKDIPNPKTVYGKNKLESEMDIRRNLKNYMILRSANVYGRGGNFFNFLVRNLEKSKPEKYFANNFYTPTYIGHLLKAIEMLMDADYSGLMHVAGKEKTSRYGFALKTAKALGKSSTLIIRAEQGGGGLISKDSSLDSRYSVRKLGIVCPSISASLDILFGRSRVQQHK